MAHLVGLSDICEHDIHHSDQHSVLERVSSVFDNGDHVRTGLRHVDEVSTGTMGEFYRIDTARWSNDVRDMRNGGTCGGSKVEYLFSNTAEDGRGCTLRA